MSDDRIQEGLDAYAQHLQQTTGLAPAAEIRRRGDRRRRNRATGAAFAAVLIAAAGVGTLINRGGGDPDRPLQPAAPSTTPSISRPSSGPPPSGNVTSNVTQLRNAGVDLSTSVLLDVPDDAGDLWLQVKANNVVDFSGAARDDTTEMTLVPAPVSGRNRVVITPAALPGTCVAATTGVQLILQTCVAGDAAQTWMVTLEGDAGAFSLAGPNGTLTVGDNGLSQDGRTILQTKRF